MKFTFHLEREDGLCPSVSRVLGGLLSFFSFLLGYPYCFSCLASPRSFWSMNSESSYHIIQKVPCSTVFDMFHPKWPSFKFVENTTTDSRLVGGPESQRQTVDKSITNFVQEFRLAGSGRISKHKMSLLGIISEYLDILENLSATEAFFSFFLIVPLYTFFIFFFSGFFFLSLFSLFFVWMDISFFEILKRIFSRVSRRVSVKHYC